MAQRGALEVSGAPVLVTVYQPVSLSIRMSFRLCRLIRPFPIRCFSGPDGDIITSPRMLRKIYIGEELRGKLGEIFVSLQKVLWRWVFGKLFHDQKIAACLVD